ncbi:MAG: MBL fold metallo-hydrolase [Nitrospinota bacterium]
MVERALARGAPELGQGPRALPVSFAAGAKGRSVSIQFYGHSAFQVISPGGTRVFTDPFGPGLGLPIPQVKPHVITIGREHPHHNSAWTLQGAPQILRGLGDEGMGWAEVRKTVGDVIIYNVPVTQRTFGATTKGSAFVFEMGGLCIAHLGDVAEPFNPSQLRRLGKVHVALVPVDGTFTVDPEGAREIVRQLNPHIAIPMHYWDDAERLGRFTAGAQEVRRHGRGPLAVSREDLPRPTTIVILGHDPRE